MVILARNYHDRFGEIDIIAMDDSDVVFVEVKYRGSINEGNPLEAVDTRKQDKIRNAALTYLVSSGYNPEVTNIRFDVIGILDTDIIYIRDAF